MKQQRLALLLATMVALLALRWWLPPSGQPLPEVSAAVARPGAAASAAVASPADAPPKVPEDRVVADLSAGTRELDASELRNAFAIRLPPAPPPAPVPPAARVAMPKPFVGPPAPEPEPPPPSPPFQVIGSWHDEQGASLFVAGPSGVRQVRAGDVLADYRIAQITPRQVLLKHLPSSRNVALAVPAGAGSPWLSSK